MIKSDIRRNSDGDGLTVHTLFNIVSCTDKRKSSKLKKFRIENIRTLTEGIKRIKERMTGIEKELMKQYKN
ncbi:hypothetical protein [Fusobacterium varium]